MANSVNMQAWIIALLSCKSRVAKCPTLACVSWLPERYGKYLSKGSLDLIRSDFRHLLHIHLSRVPAQLLCLLLFLV